MAERKPTLLRVKATVESYYHRDDFETDKQWDNFVNKILSMSPVKRHKKLLVELFDGEDIGENLTDDNFIITLENDEELEQEKLTTESTGDTKTLPECKQIILKENQDLHDLLTKPDGDDVVFDLISTVETNPNLTVAEFLQQYRDKD